MTMFSKVSIFLLLLVMVAAITAVRNDDFENLRDQPDNKFLGRFDRLKYKNLRYQRAYDDQDKFPPASNSATNSTIPKVMRFFP